MDITYLRSFKVLNLAIFDLVATFIGAFILHIFMWLYPYNKNNTKDNRTIYQYIISLLVIFFTFVGIGIIFHWVFNVNSKLSFYLGFNLIDK